MGDQILLVGKVVDTADPDKLGRVQVSMHGFTSQTKFPWIRMVQPHASKESGFTWLPEVDDEVVVLRGGSELMILGAVYNGKNMPVNVPEATDKNLYKQIRTPTNHLVQFYDKKGKGWIHIISGDEKNFIKIEEEKSIITIESAETVQVTTKVVTVDCDEATVNASKSATVNTDKALVKAGTEIVAKVGGNKVVIDAGGVVIKGSMVKIN
ncbi:MAG: phage baseplate assembly protein V [Myxococcota bacterium]|nr:phage baseplate assembly protein V [Myxococcota bacterium]